jgi:hypothetical protein
VFSLPIPHVGEANSGAVTLIKRLGSSNPCSVLTPLRLPAESAKVTKLEGASLARSQGQPPRRI